MSGGSIPIPGWPPSVCHPMNQILKVDKENMKATVEPGVVLLRIFLYAARS